MLLRGILYVLVFLPCVVIFAKVRSRAVRQAVLLIGGYAVYLTWGAWFAVVLFASTAMNFLLGTWFSSRSRSRDRSAACPKCFRSFAPRKSHLGTTSDAGSVASQQACS